jgi:hypothetical protein
MRRGDARVNVTYVNDARWVCTSSARSPGGGGRTGMWQAHRQSWSHPFPWFSEAPSWFANSAQRSELHWSLLAPDQHVASPHQSSVPMKSTMRSDAMGRSANRDRGEIM